MRPGDVLITNDAWMGTGHMSDVSVLKPIFHGDRLVAFSATTSHMPDIGGRIRAIEAREMFEEGLHIPLTWLDAGRAQPTTRSCSSSAPTCGRPTRPWATSGPRSAPTS